MKRVSVTLLIIQLIFLLATSSCEDYIERGIEGRWQLQEVKSADGQINKIDTVFYSFKKNVFEYLKLTTPTTYFHIYGNYKQTGDTLHIAVVEDTYDPVDCPNCFDWDTYTRSYVIRQHTTSRLILDLDGSIYTLRKY